MLTSTFFPVALLVQLFCSSTTAIIVRPEHLPSIFLKNLPNPLPLARSNLLLNFDKEGEAFPGKVQRATYPFGCLKAAFDEIDARINHGGDTRITGDVYKIVGVAPEGFKEADVCEVHAYPRGHGQLTWSDTVSMLRSLCDRASYRREG